MNLVFPVFCGRKLSFHLRLCWGNLQAHSCINSNNPGLCQAALRFITGASHDTHHCLLYSSAGFIVPCNETRGSLVTVYFLRTSLQISQPPPLLCYLFVTNCPTRQNKWLPLKVCTVCSAAQSWNSWEIPLNGFLHHLWTNLTLWCSTGLTDMFSLDWLWIVENEGSPSWSRDLNKCSEMKRDNAGSPFSTIRNVQYAKH